MDIKFAKTGKRMLTIILIFLMVSSSSKAAELTQITTPLEPTGGIINSLTKLQENQNQPILGLQPSSFVNQSLTGVSKSLTGFNQPSSTGLYQPNLGQPSYSSVNQPLTGFNQPSSTGFNQPISSSSFSSAQNQPFTKRHKEKGRTRGFRFINGNSKLKVSGTKIVSIWIGLFLALHGTDRN